MSAMGNHPTPYPEVNVLLQDVRERVQTVLANRFVGMYLFGSLAGGAFDEASDIDVVVVTDGEVSDDQFGALHRMHARVNESGSPWAVELDLSYIPQQALPCRPEGINPISSSRCVGYSIRFTTARSSPSLSPHDGPRRHSVSGGHP
jgi:predicted nucleotidyltransferase